MCVLLTCNYLLLISSVIQQLHNKWCNKRKERQDKCVQHSEDQVSHYNITTVYSAQCQMSDSNAWMSYFGLTYA